MEVQVKNVKLTKDKFEAVIKYTEELKHIIDHRPDRAQTGVIERVKSRLVDDIYNHIQEVKGQELIDAININEVAKLVRYRIINNAINNR